MFCKQNWRFASSLQQKLREGRIQKQTQPNSHISFDGVFQLSGDVIEIETHEHGADNSEQICEKTCSRA